MDLLCITDASKTFGVSSKTLRYYENVGILKSLRMENNKYRYYDNEAIERIKQILILRKMQISIKDIIRIYKSEDMSTVVEVFVDRIHAIDEEVGALSELKRIVSEFLQTMVQNGITKISALPLLYEEMDKQLEVLEERKSVSYEELSSISEKLSKHVDISIVDLPPMRMLSSRRKDSGLSDVDGFTDWMMLNNIPHSHPGGHELFEYQDSGNDTVILRKINDEYENDSPFADIYFKGGLFAVGSIYVDEDIGAFHRNMIRSFDANSFYEVDYRHGGGMRHESFVETVLSPDDKREKVNVFLAVKKRLPNESLYDANEQIENIPVQEIEDANPALWKKDVRTDRLIPIESPYYRVNEAGEAEYIAYVPRHRLSTGIEVKLPFRVDIEFRVDYETNAGYGITDGSLRFYHGDLTCMYGVNMHNDADERLSQEAIAFNQPILGDYHRYPKAGKINRNGYNRLAWIIGEKYFAVILNGQVRYCGVHFPYMTTDMAMQPSRTVSIGSDGHRKKYIKSIAVSQLKQTPKIRIKKEGALTMITRQSNNRIPDIRRLQSSDDGENYWFNCCAKYVMERLEEPDYSYNFFAGLTGDVLAQVYAYGKFRGDGVTDYMIGNFSSDELNGSHIESIFETCGYESTVVLKKDLLRNRKMYLQTLLSYIDKGIPVIEFGYGCDGPPWGVFVGYEEYGETLLLITGGNNEPWRVPIDEALANWVFVGRKTEQKDLRRLYHDSVVNMPRLLTTKTHEYCFGAEAFRNWAADIENGKFDGMKPEEFDAWAMHTCYVCNLATNSHCCYGFFDKAQELNPDFTFLEDVKEQYRKMHNMWLEQNGEDLEAIGGGFNITLEALQDKTRREKIAAKIREFADCADEVVRILRDNLSVK